AADLQKYSLPEGQEVRSRQGGPGRQGQRPLAFPPSPSRKISLEIDRAGPSSESRSRPKFGRPTKVPRRDLSFRKSACLRSLVPSSHGRHVHCSPDDVMGTPTWSLRKTQQGSGPGPGFPVEIPPQTSPLLSPRFR